MLVYEIGGNMKTRSRHLHNRKKQDPLFRNGHVKPIVKQRIVRLEKYRQVKNTDKSDKRIRNFQ